MSSFLTSMEIKLYQTFGHTRVLLIKKYLDAMFAYVCLSIPGILFAVCVIWAGPAEIPFNRAESHATYYKTKEEVLMLPSPLELGADTRKNVVYTAWVEKVGGGVVYRYPTMTVNAQSVKDVSLKFPTLDPGKYRVNGRIRYESNPLKDIQVDMGFGEVTVY